MINKINKKELIMFQMLSHPIASAEILFHDFDGLGLWDKTKFGNIRPCQYPMLSYDSLFLYDTKKTAEENNKIENDLVESYNLGGRLTGKCEYEHNICTLANGRQEEFKNLINTRQKILTLNQKTGKIETAFAIFKDNGKKECLKVSIEGGKEITITKNHPLLTNDGWKEIKYLKKGDWIAIPRKYPSLGKHKIDINIAKIIGYLLGDGGCTTRSVYFTNANQEIINEMKYLAKYFKCTLRDNGKYGYAFKKIETMIENPNQSNVNIVRQIVLKYKINTKSIYKVIPKEVFEWSNKYIAILLNRFFACDGYVLKREIGITLASHEMIKQIHSLLIRFGIYSVTYYTKKKYNNKYFDAWTLLITEDYNKFIRKIGVKSKDTKKIKNQKILNHDIIPKSFFLNIYDSLKGFYKKFTLRKMKIYNCSRDKWMRIGKKMGDKYMMDNVAEDIRWVKIKSILNVGEKNTVMVSVPKYENYISNDIISHNSIIFITLDSILATFKQIYKWAVISSYDNLHIKSIIEKLINCFENHKILKHLNCHSIRSPFRLDFVNGCLLEGVNQNITGKNPGGQFYQKHFDRHYMEESAFLTKEVSGKMLMSQAEKGCKNRFSGMTTFTKASPMGEIFFDLRNKKKLINLPSYVNPTWNDKKEADAIREFGGIDCLDEATEILTNNGWKTIETITYQDKVVSWDIEKNVAIYTDIFKIIKYNQCQKMYSYCNQKIDFCVSKNHILPIKTAKKNYRLEKLSAILENKKIKRPFRLYSTQICLNCKTKLDKSRLKKQKYFCSRTCRNIYMSGYKYYPIKKFYLKQTMKWQGKEQKFIKVNGLKYLMDDFLRFLGWFISEGYVCEIKEKRGLFTWTHYRISVSQSKNFKYIKEIGDILTQMNLRSKYSFGDYCLTNKQLGLWLLENCGKYAINKRVPSFIRHLSVRQINLFLDAFNKGNGDGKRKTYYTTSKQLKDDLQELIFKIGHIATYYFSKNNTNGLFTISESSDKQNSIKINQSKIVERYYNGQIWCVTTLPNKTIFIRRNGKCMWSGNSPGYQVQIEGKVFEGMESVFDILRIRETYIRDKQGDGIEVKKFEVNKETFHRFKEFLIIERPLNADSLGFYFDVGEGGAPSEYIVIVKTEKKYKYIYRITTYKLSPNEEEEFVDYLIETLKPNVVGLDHTSGLGKSMFSHLINKYPDNTNAFVAVDFNSNLEIGFKKDNNGNFVRDKEGKLAFEKANVVDWSIQCLKDIFYNDKIECYEDIKFDTQINNIVAAKNKMGKLIYDCKGENHLFQAWQVFAISYWNTEFKNIQPINSNRKPGMGSFGA